MAPDTSLPSCTIYLYKALFSVLITMNYDSTLKNNKEVLSPAVPYTHSTRIWIIIRYKTKQAHPSHYYANLLFVLISGKILCIPKNYFKTKMWLVVSKCSTCGGILHNYMSRVVWNLLQEKRSWVERVKKLCSGSPHLLCTELCNLPPGNHRLQP